MADMQGAADVDTTPLRTLLDVELQADGHGSLDDLVAKRRKVGRSWQRVCDEIEELTGRTVSRQTLLAWYPEHREKP